MSDLRKVRAKTLLVGVLLLALAATAQKQIADPWLSRPVDDRTFKTYLDFFVYDRQAPLDLRVIDVKEQEGIRKEHLSFQSTPGVRVFANLYRPLGPNPQKGLPAAILLHGGAPSGKDSPSIQALATPIARAGWEVLAFDLQYYGERSTDLLATYTEPEKAERLYNQPSVYLAWVIQTVKDVGRSIDLLVGQRGADPQRVALIGLSRGAIVGAVAGGAERRLAAVALLYGGHFNAVESGHLPAACPANYVGRIGPRPLLMINGTLDTNLVRETSVLPLYQLARPPKLILWAETGHQMPTLEHQAAMLKWLREKLGE